MTIQDLIFFLAETGQITLFQYAEWCVKENQTVLLELNELWK